MMIGGDDEHLPEVGRQLVFRPKIIDDLADLPMLGHRAQVALHQPAGGFLRKAERLLDRGAVVRLHLLEDGLLLVFVEVLDQGDRVVGLHLAREVGDLLRLHLVEQVFADEVVQLGEHVRADDPGKRLDQPFALVAPRKLDQVGDVGRVERLDKLARRFVVAGLDRIEHLVDKLGTEPVFLVDRRLRPRVQGRRRRCSRSRSCCPLPDRAALLLPRLLWRNPIGTPKSPPTIPLYLRSISMADPNALSSTFPAAATSSSSFGRTSLRAMSSGSSSWPSSGFYDGVPFHRVIPGFMAQGGDPTGRGTGGSDLPNLKAEFSREPHVRGVCSMARTQDPNSANSQFFICFDDATFLDNQYTVWGEVESGMEHVDALPGASRRATPARS